MKPADRVSLCDGECYNLLMFLNLRIELFAGDYQP